MNLDCDSNAATHLQSRTQQVRVVTENWFKGMGYCLACQSPRLEASKANSIVCDFVCPACSQSYELKSSKLPSKKRIVDGAYATMIKRISSGDVPALILLQYCLEPDPIQNAWSIRSVVGIHPVFLTSSIIEARKPLAAGTRRAGWQGCYIRIDRVPPEGQIHLVRNGLTTDPDIARRQYVASKRLFAIDPDTRGWTALVLKIVRSLETPTFQLNDVYARKESIREVFPLNHNLEAKIRQQLQILRDLSYLKFLGSGSYEVIG